MAPARRSQRTSGTTAETWTNSEARSQEVDALQKRVQTLRNSKGRKSEIETLRKRLASELEKAEAKGGDVRRQVTDQLVGRARKARERVEPVYRRASPSTGSASSRSLSSAWSPP